MRSTLAVMATGTGKTVVMAEVIRQWKNGRVMMLAHREELIFQAADKFRRHCGDDEVGIEMGPSYVREGAYRRPRIVVASVQSLNSGRDYARFEKFKPSEFGLLLTDEAHHGTADSYRRVYDWFSQNPDCRHLGVTATPDRADEEALGSIFDSVAFEYGILDAITDGFLVPIQQEFVECEGLDLSGCRSDKRDLKDNAVAEVMEKEENLYAVADSTRRLANGRKTIIFTASVQHAHRIAEILDGYDRGCAVAIDGKSDKLERRDKLEMYSRGHHQFLVNCGIATEGYDEPTVEVVSVARPTKSRALYAQMIGRGTRPLPGVVEGFDESIHRHSAIAASKKQNCTVLDFVGNSGRHKLVCTADILGGNEPDEIVARATRNAKGRGKPTDMRDELEEARLEIETEKRAASLRLTPKANFRTSVVNPFDALDLVPCREPGWLKGKQPSDKMKATLQKFGVNEKWINEASFGQASQCIQKMIDRSKAGMASYRQINTLKRFGIPATDMSLQDASKAIDRIAKNGWRAA
jgi:superfamily II DNA or RNA helicase